MLHMGCDLEPQNVHFYRGRDVMLPTSIDFSIRILSLVCQHTELVIDEISFILVIRDTSLFIFCGASNLTQSILSPLLNSTVVNIYYKTTTIFYKTNSITYIHFKKSGYFIAQNQRNSTHFEKLFLCIRFIVFVFFYHQILYVLFHIVEIRFIIIISR